MEIWFPADYADLIGQTRLRQTGFTDSSVGASLISIQNAPAWSLTSRNR